MMYEVRWMILLASVKILLASVKILLASLDTLLASWTLSRRCNGGRFK